MSPRPYNSPFSEIGAYYYESDAKIKEPKYEPLVKETIPYFLERLDAQVKKNGGYFIGGQVTWADLFFVGILDYMSAMAKFNIIEKYQHLVELKDKILNIPNIKAWVDKRPESEF